MGVHRSAKNKKALNRIFADQTKPKILAIVSKVKLQHADLSACSQNRKEKVHGLLLGLRTAKNLKRTVN